MTNDFVVPYDRVNADERGRRDTTRVSIKRNFALLSIVSIFRDEIPR